MNPPQSSIRPKVCAKTYKTAELKMMKILNKIDSLKLSNSYIARLDIPKSSEKKEKVLGRKTSSYIVLIAVLISAFVFSARWIYTEFLESRVSLFGNVPI